MDVLENFIDEIKDAQKQLIPAAGDEVTLAIVSVTALNTEFYKWRTYQANKNPELTIPTEDFKNILIEWQKFIKSHSVTETK